MPGAAVVTDGQTVVDFAGIDGDDISGTGFHRTTTARRALGATADEADAEGFVHMTRKALACISLNRFHTT